MSGTTDHTQPVEQDHTPLTGAERRLLGCECTRLDNVWHHKRGCPVPAVEQMLGERIEGNDRMHRALGQARDRQMLTLETRLHAVRDVINSRHPMPYCAADGRIVVDLLTRVRDVVEPPATTGGDDRG